MIGALITVLSLNMTSALVAAGQVAGTLPVTGATPTTPIAITSPAHGVPLGRVLHGVVAGVTGTVEANGLWVLTPTDADTFTLATFDAQGNRVTSVGAHAYAGGGTVQYAFPDFQILLGRRWVKAGSPVASPRIVFIPTDSRAIGFAPFAGPGGAIGPGRGTAEQQSMALAMQASTDFTTFEVLITGAASPPSPDFGDFDAAQVVAWTLYNAIWDAVGDAVDVKSVSWPSQSAQAGTQTQRGQQIRWIVEFQQPIVTPPLAFVPVGTTLVLTVTPQDDATPADATVITVPLL